MNRYTESRKKGIVDRKVKYRYGEDDFSRQLEDAIAKVAELIVAEFCLGTTITDEIGPVDLEVGGITIDVKWTGYQTGKLLPVRHQLHNKKYPVDLYVQVVGDPMKGEQMRVTGWIPKPMIEAMPYRPIANHGYGPTAQFATQEELLPMESLDQIIWSRQYWAEKEAREDVKPLIRQITDKDGNYLRTESKWRKPRRK